MVKRMVFSVILLVSFSLGVSGWWLTPGDVYVLSQYRGEAIYSDARSDIVTNIEPLNCDELWYPNFIFQFQNQVTSGKMVIAFYTKTGTTVVCDDAAVNATIMTQHRGDLWTTLFSSGEAIAEQVAAPIAVAAATGGLTAPAAIGILAGACAGEIAEKANASPEFDIIRFIIHAPSVKTYSFTFNNSVGPLHTSFAVSNFDATHLTYADNMLFQQYALNEHPGGNEIRWNRDYDPSVIGQITQPTGLGGGQYGIFNLHYVGPTGYNLCVAIAGPEWFWIDLQGTPACTIRIREGTTVLQAAQKLSSDLPQLVNTGYQVAIDAGQSTIAEVTNLPIPDGLTLHDFVRFGVETALDPAKRALFTPAIEDLTFAIQDKVYRHQYISNIFNKKVIGKSIVETVLGGIISALATNGDVFFIIIPNAQAGANYSFRINNPTQHPWSSNLIYFTNFVTFKMRWKPGSIPYESRIINIGDYAEFPFAVENYDTVNTAGMSDNIIFEMEFPNGSINLSAQVVDESNNTVLTMTNSDTCLALPKNSYRSFKLKVIPVNGEPGRVYPVKISALAIYGHDYISKTFNTNISGQNLRVEIFPNHNDGNYNVGEIANFVIYIRNPSGTVTDPDQLNAYFPTSANPITLTRIGVGDYRYQTQPLPQGSCTLRVVARKNGMNMADVRCEIRVGTAAPLTPTGLSATAGNQQVALNWTPNGENWTCATGSAAWSIRSSHASVDYNNKIWVSGGWGGSNRNDVWYSTDGVNWTQATANAAWSGRSGHCMVVFNNKMWVLGGSYRNDVWYSTDGVNWTQATANAGWSVRWNHTAVVFDNKIWVLGGTNGSVSLNDVWYSTDGANWTQATANAGWSVRYSHTCVVFDNKIWVIGGLSSAAKNDVWYSTNGTNWIQATANAEWSARYFHAAVVFDNKMWVLGGYDGSNQNDVWSSTNGVNWINVTTNAGWSPRKQFVSVVFSNKIWTIGGYDGNLRNDIWYYSNPTGTHRYRIYRGLSGGGSYALIDSVYHPTHTYTNTGLTNGTTYYYKISAINSAGQASALTSPVSATPTPPNSAPVLSNASISPSSPTDGEYAAVYVKYQDPDGQSPTWVRVYNDAGGSSIMTSIGPFPENYRAGVNFCGGISFNGAGSHGYHFMASDGINTTRYPSSGEISVTIQPRPPQQPLQLDSIRVNPKIISPLVSPDTADNCTLAYKLNNSAIVKIEVMNSSNTSVRTLVDWNDRTNVLNHEIWNGRDNSNNIVSDGSYFFKIQASDFDQWPPGILAQGQFAAGYGDIAVDTIRNRIYIVEMGNCRVKVFDRSGNYLTSFGSSGSAHGQFGIPQGIGLDNSGNIYVCDRLFYRVEIFNSSYQYIRTLQGAQPASPTQFRDPFDVAIDERGNIYVLGNKNADGLQTIMKYRSDFSYVGQDSTLRVDTYSYSRIAYGRGLLAVSYAYLPQRIQLYDTNLVRTISIPGVFTGVAFDGDGYLITTRTDAYNKPFKYNPTNGVLIVAGRAVQLGGYTLFGIAIDAQGYFLDLLTERIWKIKNGWAQAVGSVNTIDPMQVQVDNTPPLSELDYPHNNDTLSDVVRSMGTALDPNFNQYVLGYVSTTDQTKTGTIRSDTVSVDSSLLGEWNTNSLPNGTYKLRLLTYDNAYNRDSAIVTVNINHSPPGVSLDTVYPIVFSPNGDNIKDTFTVTYTLSKNALVSINIFDANNSLIRTLLNGAPKSLGTNIAKWDGKNNNSEYAGDGIYKLMLVASDSVNNQSSPESTFVTIDRINPTVSITSPSNGALLSGLMSFIGTATDANPLFREMFYGKGQIPNSWTRWDSSGSVVVAGLLSMFSTFNVNDTVYTFKLKMQDQAGNNDSASVWVTIDNSPPNPPVLVCPTDTSAFRNRTPLFIWGRTRFAGKKPVDSDLVNYTFQLGKDFRFITYDTTIIFNQDTAWQCPISLPDTSYYWHVKATDAAGNEGLYQNYPFEFTVDNVLPLSPILMLPADSAIINADTVMLYWHRSIDNGCGVRYYILRRSNNYNFTTYVDTLVYDTVCKLHLSDSIYYWKVKAVDRATNESNWSNIRYFEVDTRVPAIPILAMPIGGVWQNDTNVIFSWSQVTFEKTTGGAFTPNSAANSDVSKSPVRYILYVSSDTGFTSSIVDTTGLSCDTIMFSQGRYYWKVKAYDLAGNQGFPSGRDSFGIDVVAPSVPVLINPVNGVMTNNPNVTFVWNRSTDNLSGVLRYTLEYARNSGFTNPIDTVVTDSFITLTLTDTTYYWRGNAVDKANNQSNWSTLRSFELDTRIPNAPVLNSPINGVWFTDTIVVFNWSQVTSDKNMKLQITTDNTKEISRSSQIISDYFTFSPVRYILQVDTNRSFSHPIADTTGLCYDTLALNQTRYYWRVSAYDLAGNQGSFSNPDSFGVDATAPTAPVLIEPTNGMTIRDTVVNFKWHRSQDILSGVFNYGIQVSHDSGFGLHRDTIVTDTVCRWGLPDSQYYYWHIQAVDRAGNQTWSQVRGFTLTQGIEEIYSIERPNIFTIYQNSPNPFYHSTEIRYGIPITCKVKITIFTSTGREVKTLSNNIHNQGWYSVRWDGRDNKGKKSADGVYFYRLETEEYQITRKMLMLK